jgi:nucleotide-binding universal stress UspA family protein
MNAFRLLIGYDGSLSAKAALDDLKWAGLPEMVHARVVSVADVFLSTWPGKSTEVKSDLDRVNQEELDKSYALALEAARSLRQHFPRWKIDPETHANNPGWGIVNIADSWRPHLIQLGSRGCSTLTRLFLGSVSQKILNHARSSVRIVPANRRRSDLGNRLVIGFDSSTESRRAVHAVAQRRWPAGTEVKLVTVMDTRVSTLMHLAMEGGKNQRKSYAQHYWDETLMQPLVNKLKGVGLNASAQIIQGDPRIALLREAHRWKASQLFLGDRGLTGIQRFVLGGVSASIAAHATCAVEIVRDIAINKDQEECVEKPELKSGCSGRVIEALQRPASLRPKHESKVPAAAEVGGF